MIIQFYHLMLHFLPLFYQQTDLTKIDLKVKIFLSNKYDQLDHIEWRENHEHN